MIVWDVDPAIFSINIFGFNLEPRYYSLAFVIGFFFGERYVHRYMVKNGYTKDDVGKLFTYMLLGTILGARLGHCLFYEPSYYLAHPLEILKIWNGGLASHGGFAGVVIAVWLFSKKVPKNSILFLWDLIAFPSLITGSYIRLGNLMNSEILGHPSDLPWAFVFKRVDNIPRHPTQLYEAIGFFTVSVIGFYLYKKYHEKWPAGRFIGIASIGGFGWRFVVEFFKENQVGFEQGMMLNMGQLLSIPMFIMGLIFIFREQIFKKSGVKK